MRTLSTSQHSLRHTFADYGELQLEEALRLLRHAGHGASFEQGINDPMALQALIDGLCELSSRDGLTGMAGWLTRRLTVEG